MRLNLLVAYRSSTAMSLRRSYSHSLRSGKRAKSAEGRTRNVKGAISRRRCASRQENQIHSPEQLHYSGVARERSRFFTSHER